MRRLALRLTVTSKAICAAVIVVVALASAYLLNKMVIFGRGLDYHQLDTFSDKAAELARQYMPLIWIAAAVLLALIIVGILYRYARATLWRARQRIVNAGDFSEVARQLSPDAREVLAWAWEDRRYPVTVGVLQRAIQELRAGRAGKIYLARTHAQALDAPVEP
jgi:hypothetical protein